MRFFRKGLIGLFLLSLCAGLLAYAGQMVSSSIEERASKGSRPSQKRERVFTVNVMMAEPQTIAPVLTAYGEVKSRRTLDLRMASGGQVIELSPHFVEGGRVEAGDVLVRLNPSDARSTVQRLEADLTDAKAELEDAERALVLVQDELTAALAQSDLRKKALARQVDLQKRGVGTAAAVEAAELAMSSADQAVLVKRGALDQMRARKAQATTRLARAELALEDGQRRLDDTTLIAEFDGVLNSVTLVKGGLVSPNERLGQLIDKSDLEVAVRISTEQYSRLLNDQGELIQSPVMVLMDVLGTPLSAKATVVRDSGAVAEGQTGRLIFAAMKEPRGFKPGDFVRVEITEPAQNYVMKLPASALNAASEVLLLGEDERLEVLKVKLVRRQGNDILVRARGLAGKEVVMEQTPVLGPGIKVKAVRTGADGPKIEEPAMVELAPERRAKLIAFIEANAYIPEDAKNRILGQLRQDKVPLRVVERIESRLGG